MAVLENRPSKTLGFLHVFFSENDFFNTLLKVSCCVQDANIGSAVAAVCDRQVLSPRTRGTTLHAPML